MRAIASLTITSSILTTDAITQRLALQPTRSHDVGDPVDPKRYPDGPFQKQALWVLESTLPRSAPLERHLQSLIGLFESRRAALTLLRAVTMPRFFCGLFGDYETVAVFDIPAGIIGWCSDVLEISLDCYPCFSSIEEAEADALDTESEPREDLAFSYLASAIDRPSLGPPHERNNVPSDPLLPRPIASRPIVVASDLPESSEPSQHFHRIFDLLRIRQAGGGASAPELTCLFTTNRAAGSIVRLEIPILAQLAELGAGFRIGVYQTPSALRRLRQLS
jgi:hypothetical protein